MPYYILILIGIGFHGWLCCSVAQSKECVILLHGLARTSDSMKKLENRLSDEGYVVANIDYPSRKHPIQELADPAVEQGIGVCENAHCQTIHFVTHSLGGILVRYYLKENKRNDIGRVVMLGPPNQGSQVVDHLKDAPGFELLNGPAGRQLGTDAESLPRLLGPVDFEVGIIAGTRSINLFLSTLLPNPDDGKVSVDATKVAGMKDFIALPVTHPFMMKNGAVLDQVVYFLKTGKFMNSNQ